jgi:hypothetical protein
VIAGAGLVSVGVLLLRQPTGGAASGLPAVPAIDRGAVPSSRRGSAPPHAPASGPGTVLAGAHLRIARLHVSAPIVRVRVHDGVMGVPRDPKLVGWWRDGAAPGDSSGTAVIVGHVNYAGVPGALGRVPELRPGDRLELSEPGADLRYRVAAVRAYPKARGLPASAFTRTGSPRLVLITCGGSFDPSTGNYQDNVVAWAVPA